MSDRDLILRAATLARSAPESWEKFLGALAQYTETQRHNCISSPIEMLPVTQGRAQACVHLLALLKDCSLTADKIEGRNK
jgi:hypothetical protein